MVLYDIISSNMDGLCTIKTADVSQRQPRMNDLMKVKI